ncbi:MAG: FixH family protein [Chromatiales bacterium]|jgi:hypothetical protein|nr:FixH family protein [Chromatiales bacterium]MDX9766845.1 FixH family protein [Ectothiorhodospiraceae bacterium]
MNPTSAAQTLPWYRHVWPWLLMVPPLAAVAMGIVIVTVSIQSADGLVVGDYYKEGRAINQVLEREQFARELGLTADLRLEAGELSLRLDSRVALPEQNLHLKVLHPTRANKDLDIALVSLGEGRYSARLDQVVAGSWYLHLEPADRSWRLSGRMQVPGDGHVRLAPEGV